MKRRFAILLSLCFSITLPLDVYAWGALGHETIGYVAMNVSLFLSESLRLRVLFETFHGSSFFLRVLFNLSKTQSMIRSITPSDLLDR